MPNPNRPSHYGWMRELLDSIAAPQPTAPVKDLRSGREGTPLFVVVGACPSVFAGMQVRRPPGMFCGQTCLPS